MKEDIPSFLFSAPIGIIIIENGKISFVNEYILELLDYTKNDLLKKNITKIVSMDQLSHIETRWEKSIESPIVINELRINLISNKKNNVGVNLMINEDSSNSTVIWYITSLGSTLMQKPTVDSDQTFKEVMELQTDLIVRWKPNGTRIYVNDAYCRYFDITKEEAIGTSIYDTMMPEIIDSVKSQIKAFSRENSQFNIDRRVILKTGEIRWNQWVGTASFDKEGKVTEILSVGRDITRLKQSEMAAKRNEQYFRNLFEHNPVATIVHDFSEIKRISDTYNLNTLDQIHEFIKNNPDLGIDLSLPFTRVAINSAYQKLFKIKNIDEFLISHADTTFYKETRIQYSQSLNEFLDGSNLSTFRTKHQDLEGNEVHVIVKRTIDISTEIPWERIYTTLIDITDLVRAQQELEDSENKYRSLFETAQEAIFLIDPVDHTILDCNSLGWSMFGYTKQETEGKSIDKIISYDISHQELLDILDKSSDPYITNSYATCKDGTRLAIESSIKMMVLGNKRILLNLVRDITRRKQSEEELQNTRAKLYEAQKMEAIGRMSGGIAHDFNNLLTMINLNAEFLAEIIPVGTEPYEMVKEILTSIKKASSITSELLLFSKNRVMNPEIIEINTFLQQFYKSYRKILSNKIIFTLSLPDSDIYVNCDPLLLEQVLMNISNNAIDAMESEGKLEIVCKFLENNTHLYDGIAFSKDSVVIKFIDSGPGITSEVKNKMFEPFFTTKEGKGTGLGLANVYHIIRQFNGYIEVANLEPKGFSFNIYLPISDLKTLNDNAKSLKKRGRKRSTARILVVDDDQNIRLILKKILNSNKLEVLEAKDGEEGISIYEEFKDSLDLIITDIRMPRMDGTTFISSIRENDDKIPVIYITGFTSNFEEVANSRRENERIMQKPFHLENLIKEVVELVGLETDSKD